VSNDRLDVKVVSNQNSVELTKNENTVVVSDKKRDTSISVLQKETAVVTVASKGPKGDRGDKGDPGIVTFNSISGGVQITGSLIVSGSSGQNVTITQNLIVSGTITSPGSNRQIIFNNGGVLGSDSGFVFDVNKRLGIGTTSPSELLHISNSGNTRIKIQSNPTNEASLDLKTDSTTNDFGLRIVREAGTNGSSTIGHKGIDRLYIATLDAGNLELATDNITRLFVSSNGNVGIGTSTPTNKLQVIGGITATSITGSLLGTSSWAQSASNAVNAINAQTASFLPIGTYSITSSQTINAQTASFLPIGTYSITSSWAQSASNAVNAHTASFLSGAFLQNGNSFGTTTTLGTNDTQDLQLETNNITRVFISSSGNVGIGTSSPTERLHVDGNMIVTGRITAEEFHTEFVSASIIYQSGSTQFGNTLDDTHIFTGSLNLTGSLTVNGKTIDESINSASVSYVSQSGDIYSGLNQIEVQDFSNDVAVNWVNGRLKFIFGSPTSPSSITLTLSGFDTDRFNRVFDGYSINGSWNNGAYNIISASLYTGSVLLTSTTSGTSLSLSLTTSGSQSYSLQYTASSPLDGSIFSGSASATGTLSKSNPGSPTLTLTPSVQLGGSSNQIERGATGSISFTSASGAANGWVLNFVSTNFNSPYIITGSATGSASIPITAIAYYSSSGVNGSDNDPALTTTTSTTTTYTKIVSLRHGAASDLSFTEAQLDNLSGWDTTLGGSIGTIVKGTVNPSGQSVTISWTGDKYHYIVYSGSRSNLTNITTNGFGVLGSFSVSTVGNYKVYRTTTLNAGGAGNSITYVLT
jgi:hypothetical protein